MTKAHAARYIANEKASTRSTDDQIAISHTMWDENIGPSHGGLRKDEIENELDLDLEYNVGTSLAHLEEIDVVEGVSPPGPEFYAISKHLDEIVLGRVDEVAAEDMEALIEHIQDDHPLGDEPGEAVADGSGISIRTVVADAFDVIPEAVEKFLREGDTVDKLATAVDAIEESEHVEKRDDYDKIIFRRGAIKFRLTSEQVERYNRPPGPGIFDG